MFDDRPFERINWLCRPTDFEFVKTGGAHTAFKFSLIRPSIQPYFKMPTSTHDLLKSTLKPPSPNKPQMSINLDVRLDLISHPQTQT